MFKKLISLICCLLPVGAGAAVHTLNSDGVILTNSDEWKNAVGVDNTIRIEGNSSSINDVNGVTDAVPGVNFANGLYFGTDTVQNQNSALYIISGLNNTFDIETIRDVSIGTMLEVLDGRNLNIRGVYDGAVYGRLLVGDNDNSAVVRVGAGSSLHATNLNSIQVNGPVRVDGMAELSAGDIGLGVVSVNSGGVANIKTTQGNLNMGALNVLADSDNTTTLRADIYSAVGIVSGTIQNASNDDIVRIQAVKDIEINGNLENSGVLLDVSGEDIVVSGAVKNDGAESEISFVANSLTITGDGSDVSLFNRGNFDAVISGKTTFAKGVEVDATTGTFSLTTGTIDLGTSNQALLNSLKSFTLNVTDSTYGVLNATTIENSGADMTLDVKNKLSASYLSALQGNLSVTAANVVLNGGNIGNVSTAINVASGANLQIVSSGSLVATGSVSNRGKTTMNAANISLDNISNDGDDATLYIGSSTSPIGQIQVGGDVANSAGIFTLYAKNVSVDGQMKVTDGGVTNVIGSDSGDGVPMKLGGITVDGSTLNLKALANNVDVNGNMLIDNAGIVDLDSSVESIAVAKDFYLDGTLDIGANIFDLSANKINIVNGWKAEKTGQTVQFVSNDIDITGDVSAVSGSGLIFADNNTGTNKTTLDITGVVGGSGSSGTITIYSDIATVGALNHSGLIREYGDSIIASTGDINIGGTVRFDSLNTYNAGLSLMSDAFLLKTSVGNIALNSVRVAADKQLTLDSADVLTIGALNNSGSLSAEAQTIETSKLIENSGVLSVNAGTIELEDIKNTTAAKIDLLADKSVSVASITNSGLLDIAYDDNVSVPKNISITGNILNETGGILNLSFDNLSAKDITVTGGTVNLNASGNTSLASDVSAANIKVTGEFVQGAQTGSLNLVGASQLKANSLKATNFYAADENVVYDLTGVDITNGFAVDENATVTYDVSGAFKAGNISNNGYVNIVATDGIKVGNQVANTGNMSLDSGSNHILANSFNITNGQTELFGAGLTVKDDLIVKGVLGQDALFVMMHVMPDTYTINAGTLNVGGISQSGKLNIMSSDVTVNGDIFAENLTISANPSTNWMNVFVDGDVSGGVDFIGLEKMHITGDYVFSGTSSFMAAILPYADGVGMDTTDINYWATVNMTDGKLGQITNAPDAKPLIDVDGTFSSDLAMNGLGSADNKYLEDSQIGIKIFDMIDQGTAIWLLHADGGVSDISAKIRNINVKFCNEDGSTCVAYFNDLDPESDGLPAYISVRDSDGDGQTDSLYVVFDDRFGGPAALFPIQPIVGRLPMRKDSEYSAAGAIDSIISAQLQANKFYNKTPLEVLPVVFQGTNMELSMTELYNRMEDYLLHYNGTALSSFSRLFEGTDGEQAASLMSLNEHATFRSFEDRMVDEFIWNRNRRLDKAWMDVDYGMFYQNLLSGNHTDGNRFAISGGFDWQESDTLILGLSGHVSHSASSVGELFDLSYGSVSQMGQLDTRVTDTNVGFGGYLMKTLGDKARLYGNAFIDAHLFNVERNQTFVDAIDGNGTAFSLISEFGLLHDILNQYIVGNVYARVGYNFGLNISSDISDSEFMEYKQDGYFMLTPGYSLTAQKRIYPSAWLQIRPYATIGVEYDVFGMQDSIEYKFAGATDYSTYDMNVNPLWANIGGGFEVLSANGLQFGLDYRYQYNQEMQLHNIRFTGMYRF